LENLSAVKEASADLLKQLGVVLTDAGLAELKKPLAISQVNAETALAKGVTAQKQGTEVAALSYFFQAASLDSSLTEAAKRSSTMSASISSGNIGADLRNDIQWRRDWVARLTETENYLKNLPPPYTLIYSTGIEKGATDYQTETTELKIQINMQASGIPSLRKALQAVYDGLNATNRKTEWKLADWPTQSLTNPNPFTSEKKYDIQVVFELVNEKNQVIGRQTININRDFSLTFEKDQIGVKFTENKFDTITFNAVKADDISDTLTIRIASVNGNPPQNAQFQITASPANVIIPNGVTSIGDSAYYASFITSVTIPNSVINIERYAFSNNRLTSITIPNSVISIGESAFSRNQLTTVIIPNSVTSIGVGAFSRNQLTSVTISNKVTSIGNSAFSNNQLTSVTIPNSVKSIGGFAFFNNKLTSVTIPNNVTSIGNSAFSENQLTSVTIPNRVISIGEEAFSNNKLTSVTIPNSVTSIGNRAFSNNQLTSVTISNKVTRIGSSAFSKNQLISVTIPNGVTKIENYSFSNNLLTSVTIPNSVTSIGEQAFALNKLTSVTIPNSVTSIGKGAFWNNQLTSVTIPNSVTSIDESVFLSNPLTSITIGANVNFEGKTSAIESSFDRYYNNNGKKAGTYTRSSSSSSTWTKK